MDRITVESPTELQHLVLRRWPGDERAEGLVTRVHGGDVPAPELLAADEEGAESGVHARSPPRWKGSRTWDVGGMLRRTAATRRDGLPEAPPCAVVADERDHRDDEHHSARDSDHQRQPTLADHSDAEEDAAQTDDCGL
jgi:hypothetical protein